MEAHCDTFSYRDQLAQQVDARRAALGIAATAEQPAHLVDLLGPVPDDDAGRTRWTQLAGGVEAYREEWGVELEQLRDPPFDAVQYREWDTAVKTVELINRLDALQHDRSPSRGLGLEL